MHSLVPATSLLMCLLHKQFLPSAVSIITEVFFPSTGSTILRSPPTILGIIEMQPREATQRKCRKHHSVSNQEKLRKGNVRNIIMCPTKRNYAEEMQETSFCVQPREATQRKCRKHHSVSNQEKLRRGNAGNIILCPTKRS